MSYIVSENGVLDVMGVYRYITSQPDFPFDPLEVECNLEDVLAFYDLNASFRTVREREALRKCLVRHAYRRRGHTRGSLPYWVP
jgi:hypothetical protein